MIHLLPEPADIGLTRITGPVGKAIRIGQWFNGDGFDDFEHAFVVLDDQTLIEAYPGGARIRPLTEYNPADVLYVTPAGITHAQRLAVVAAARSYEGVPYSGLDYAALAAHRMHIPAPGLRQYIESTGHMICSQLADRAHLDAGVHLFSDGRWPGYVTPDAIRNALIADGPAATAWRAVNRRLADPRW